MNYTLEKYDFRNYLLAELKDTKQDEFIFWKNTIPVPVDLIYTMFEKRGLLLKKYLDHIGAACLYAFAVKAEGRDWQAELARQPTKDNRPQVEEIRRLLKKYFDRSGVGEMLKQLAEILLLNDFVTDEEALAQSLCHDGRKYKRLYLHSQIKDVIRDSFPDILSCIAVSNGDMFSNVVTDELHVYRMGFADAFSPIFNKLIDFVLDHSETGRKSYSSASAYTVTDVGVYEVQEPPAFYGKVSDGSIWEPVYKDSVTGYVINSNHPFFGWVRSKGPDAEEIFVSMIAAMAQFENDIMKVSDRTVVERFRQDVSRSLRLQTETVMNEKGA
jgi:hypothetical protein